MRKPWGDIVPTGMLEFAQRRLLHQKIVNQFFSMNIILLSLCEHHLVPFMGHVSIGYLPRGKVSNLKQRGGGGAGRTSHIDFSFPFGFFISCLDHISRFLACPNLPGLWRCSAGDCRFSFQWLTREI